MKITKFIPLIIVIPLLTFIPLPTDAQTGYGLTPIASTENAGPVDPGELGSYLDSVFNQQIEQNQIVGITVAAVKDGQVIFQRGYGKADLVEKVPVDPTKTIFRIGSVTKVFTWIAVLQLYEQGKLNLDTDINTYLDFHIPDTFLEPITMKHLMSHTAGFEDRKFEMAVTSPEQLLSLGRYLADHIPTRVRSVGQVSAYSNYGADLAGYIVERISGIPYSNYVEANIFKPLGMGQTTAVEPLPADLRPNMSQGYRLIKGTIQPGFFELLSTQPSGAISSTASDMARFMMACLDGKLFAKESTQQLMLSRLWSHSPEFTGLTYGFWELNTHGQRILYHPGDTLQFHSFLMLIPDQNLGFFVSYNTQSAENLWDKTMLDFMQHFYPKGSNTSASIFSSKAQLNKFAGTYHISRSSYTTIEKVGDLLDEWLVVKASSNGILWFGSPLQPEKIELTQLQPLVFVEPRSGIQLAFREDAQGNITHLIDLHYPAQTYEKVPWHANPSLHYLLLIGCCVIFLSAIISGLVNGIRSLFRRPAVSSLAPAAMITRWLSFITSIIFLVALIAFVIVYLNPEGFKMAIPFGQVTTINIILAAWLGASILTLGQAISIVVVWEKHLGRITYRLQYTLATMAAVAFVWFLNYWNLLGFRY